MAEQNVLAGDKAVLDQIISDFAEYNANKDTFDNLSAEITTLSSDIEISEKAVNDEIEAKIKESLNSICDVYDKSIVSDKDKIKDVQADREKAKLAGVKERMANETSDLRGENENLKRQISEAFNTEHIPMFCNSGLYLSLFLTRGFKDVLIYIASILVLYLIIPGALLFIPEFPVWGMLIYYVIMVLIVLSLFKIIYAKTVVKHCQTIEAARKTKNDIRLNIKKIKRIEKDIKNDKNEDQYGLQSFDYKINELHDDIRRIEEEKDGAIAEFEKTAKADIIAEIQGRNSDRINEMKLSLQQKTEQHLKLEDLTAKQRIYISSNYETYLGKEFMSIEKLKEVSVLMAEQPEAADNIANATALYKEQHK